MKLPEVKVQQTISRKAFIGLWIAVNTTMIMYLDIDWWNTRDGCFIVLFAVNLAFMIELFSIEKPFVSAFLSRFIQTMFSRDMTDAEKLDYMSKGTSQYLSKAGSDSAIKAIKDNLENNKLSVPVKKDLFLEMYNILDDGIITPVVEGVKYRVKRWKNKLKNTQ